MDKSTTVLGNKALAAKAGSAVVGATARATDFGSVLGFGEISNGSYSTSVGSRSISIGHSAVAMGYQAFANGNGTVAIGQAAISSATRGGDTSKGFSIAIGAKAQNADTNMGGHSLAVGPS